MGLIDSFSSEDRVDVKFSTFYSMMKGCAERDLLVNAVKAGVPHRYIQNMLTGVPDNVSESEEETDE